MYVAPPVLDLCHGVQRRMISVDNFFVLLRSNSVKDLADHIFPHKHRVQRKMISVDNFFVFF